METPRDWLAADRENLQMHGRLSLAANRWREGRRTPDLLLQPGKPLDEARQLLAAQFPLSAVERELVEASERQARRIRMIKRTAIAALAVLTVAATIGLGLAQYERRRADAARVLADEIRRAGAKGKRQRKGKDSSPKNGWPKATWTAGCVSARKQTLDTVCSGWACALEVLASARSGESETGGAKCAGPRSAACDSRKSCGVGPIDQPPEGGASTYETCHGRRV